MPFAAFAAPALLGGEALGLGAAAGAGEAAGAGAAFGGLSEAEAATAGGLGSWMTGLETAAPSLASGVEAAGGASALGYGGAPAFVDAATAETGGSIFNPAIFAPGQEAAAAPSLASSTAAADVPSSGVLGAFPEEGFGAGPGASAVPLTETPGYYGAPGASEFTAPTPANPFSGGAYGIPSSPAQAASPSLLPQSLQSTGAIGATLKDIAPIAGLGGLGYNLYQGYESKKALQDLANQQKGLADQAAQTAATERTAAAPLIAKGEDLMHYIGTNTLPPEFQANIDQQVKAAKARAIQGYASRGMSANPNQNSALAQDLASIDANALDMRSKTESMLADAGNKMTATANQLLNSGMTATQLAAEIPIMMQKLEIELNNQSAQSLATFASALGGTSGSKNVTLKLA